MKVARVIIDYKRAKSVKYQLVNTEVNNQIAKG